MIPPNILLLYHVREMFFRASSLFIDLSLGTHFSDLLSLSLQSIGNHNFLNLMKDSSQFFLYLAYLPNFLRRVYCDDTLYTFFQKLSVTFCAHGLSQCLFYFAKLLKNVRKDCFFGRLTTPTLIN